MLLGSTKSDLDATFGKPVIAPRLFDLPGEKTWKYPWGDFELVAGFLGTTCRYLAVKRRRGPDTSLTPAELAGALALNGPAALWTQEVPDAPAKKPVEPRRKPKIEPAPTTYLSLVERDPKVKDTVLREIRGWMPGAEPYAFFYLPALTGHPPLLVSEWGVHRALG